MNSREHERRRAARRRSGDGGVFIFFILFIVAMLFMSALSIGCTTVKPKPNEKPFIPTAGAIYCRDKLSYIDYGNGQIPHYGRNGKQKTCK